MNLRYRKRYASLVAMLVVLVLPPVAKAQELQLPNLTPSLARDLIIGEPDHPEEGERALRFSTYTMNVGEFHLDLVGIPPRTDLEHAATLQCVAWIASRTCIERRDAGDFEFAPGHQHWHFQDFARYELRSLANGEPDMSPAGLVAEGNKASFCLMDSERVQDPSSASGPFSESARYSLCAGVLQGISAGWADSYGYGLEGQQIIIDDVPDGNYALVITLNPKRTLLETQYSDNFSMHRLRIENGGTNVIPLEG